MSLILQFRWNMREPAAKRSRFASDLPLKDALDTVAAHLGGEVYSDEDEKRLAMPIELLHNPAGLRDLVPAASMSAHYRMLGVGFDYESAWPERHPGHGFERFGPSDGSGEIYLHGRTLFRYAIAGERRIGQLSRLSSERKLLEWVVDEIAPRLPESEHRLYELLVDPADA